MDVHTIGTLLFSHWSFEPQIIGGLLVSAVFYALGVQYSRRRGMARALTNWRIVSFAGGLVVIWLALESPIDYWNDVYFWLHMLQHEMLIFIAPPLLLLGMPMMPMWRGVPLGLRSVSLRWVMKRRWPRRVWHHAERVFAQPRVTWILFLGAFSLWHLPVAYDLTLDNAGVHNLEHITFLGTAVLFWLQVIPSLPFKPRMTLPIQAVYLFTAAVADNVISLVFMYWTTPIYRHYAQAPRTPDMLSALADQRWAGGVMDAIGTLAFTIAILIVVMNWLAADERADEPQAVPTKPRPHIHIVGSGQ